MRKLLLVFVVLGLMAGVVYVALGRAAGPTIVIAGPEKFVGVLTPLRVSILAPSGRVSAVRVTFEQDGKVTTLAEDGKGVQVDDSGAKVELPIGRDNIPGLRSGPARLTVTAARPVLGGIRTVTSQETRELQVRLERPRVTVLSTHHYINVGGSELIVFRAEPSDVESGVRVGDVEYPSFPAAGLKGEGIQITDPAVRVAFFALLWDQDANTSMRVFARDEAGNQATAEFDRRTFPKPARQSRIELPDAFIDRVVPAILAGTTEVAPQGTTIEKFLVINGELRRKNAEKIASFANQSSPEWLWGGAVFHPFTNTAVQSAFADRRTYIYQGREVDRQTHLGFDLASYAGTPIVAANRGKVLFADELGIYGNTVILDHGMGVQSLYAHLSSIGVKVGDVVEKSQALGRSGMTGMAAGDHLHFTMLVAGRMVNPIEWWDSHWIEDRILRKLREVK